MLLVVKFAFYLRRVPRLGHIHLFAGELWVKKQIDYIHYIIPQ